ncbi:recombinase family protein [Streptomyces sp. MTZ3.1]|uniref:Recombinase family protein n=2 Tax=Streptomyces meridianus TaxID=2938945 RepID=A0ABT0X318_9ACTN|nr:recombinase family protein [Streptomyces meridianus]
MKPTRVLLYARVSRSAEESTSVSRQLTEGRDHAASRWPGVPVLEFSDDGVSGAIEPASRPAFGRLMSQWQPGDVVLAWKLDRLARSTLRFLELAQVATEAGVAIATVRDGIDLSTAEGRLLAHLLAVFAEFEREQVRSRVSATRRQLQKTGRWTGGRIPYGLTVAPHPDGTGKVLVRDAVAAEIIREVARRIVAGEGITAIARDLQDRGVPSPRVHTSVRPNPKPAAWSSSAIRDVLGHPSIVGHAMDPLTGRLRRDGAAPDIMWEPVLTETERARVVAALPAQTGKAAPAGKHWLYAVVTCGTCGRNMHASSGYRSTSPMFKCLGTGKDRHDVVTVRIVDAEEHVQGAVLKALGGAQHGTREWVGGTDSTADRERLTAFMTELMDDRRAGLYSTPEGTADFRRRYAEAEADLKALESTPAVESGWRYVPSGEYLDDAWARWSPEERGTWLRDSGVRFAISRPVVKRARVPLADRCSVDWGHLEPIVEGMEAVAADVD